MRTQQIKAIEDFLSYNPKDQAQNEKNQQIQMKLSSPEHEIHRFEEEFNG